MSRFHVQVFLRRDTTLGWRLLGGNHREVGRGARRHLEESACRDEVVLLRDAAGRLNGRVRPAPDNRWIWELDLDGDVVAVAGHTFDRMIRCEQSLNLFVARLPEAEVACAVAVRREAARRRSREIGALSLVARMPRGSL